MEQEEEPVKPPPEQQMEKVKIPKGDYVLHIYVEDGRAFMPEEEGGTIDPVVQVEAFKKKKQTAAKDDIGGTAMVFWGEHLFFDAKNIDESKLTVEKITIKVMNHRALLRDSLIGLCEIDMYWLYGQDDHKMMHRWLALFSPEGEDYDKLKGYLKISACLLHEDDRSVDLTVKDQSCFEDEELMVPPQLKPQRKQLLITFISGQNLVRMDTHGTIDAYCEVHFSGAKLATDVITADKATMSVEWYEKLYMPIIEPSISSKILVSLYDKDNMSSPELAATLSFDIENVKSGLHKELFWAQLYGGPENKSDKEAIAMNVNPNIASTYRGKILMSLEIWDMPKPVYLKEKMMVDEDVEEEIMNFDTGEPYELRCKIFKAVALPWEDSQYSIRVKWLDIQFDSQVAKAQKGCAVWMKDLGRRTTELAYGSNDNVPDVFVYLRYKDDNICYFRVPFEKINIIDKTSRWYDFTPDKSLNIVKNEWEAGFLKIRLYLGRLDAGYGVNDFDWGRDPEIKQTNKKILMCNLFQCRDLSPSDYNGSADPYVKFNCGGFSAQTQIGDKLVTLNPVSFKQQYYERIPLTIELDSIETAPPLIVQVMDYDSIGADDLIGVYVVDISEAEQFANEAPLPTWRILKRGRDEPYCGEILISFNLYETEVPQFSIVQIIIRPESKEVQIDINILGLRDLKPSLGWVPVNKAYIKFDLNSLQLPGEGNQGYVLQTQPLESGANPNINSVISFNCKIPTNPLFCPTLSVIYNQCTVHDYLMRGLAQPVIGTFSIKLGDILAKKLGLRQQTVQEKRDTQVYVVPRRPVTLAESLLQESLAVENDTEEDEEKVEVQKPNQLASLFKSTVMQMLLSTTEARMGKIVRKPQFEPNKGGRIKEINPPTEQEYVRIGYNRTLEDDIMHYRYQVAEELEKSDFIDETPFNFYFINKGIVRGNSQNSNANSHAGKFKGLIRVNYLKNILKKEEKRKEDKDDLDDDNSDDEFENIGRLLMSPTELLVRVYILDGWDIESKDEGSPSDPYLRFKLGKQVIRDKENTQMDTFTPQFFKHYDFQTTIPGPGILTIQLWDSDDPFPDDKIGSTEVDLEDRFFSSKWGKLPHKPIETRKLYIKTSRRPQGYLRMWVELHKVNEIPSPYDITPKPPQLFQARVIVWRCRGVEAGDSEGVGDLYVRVLLNDCKSQQTDVHFRCQGGNGSWNWRMLFDVQLPAPRNFITFQMWDRDYFSANDFMGETTFTFERLAKQAWEEGIRVKKYGKGESITDRMRSKKTEKFWLDLKTRTPEGEFKNAGELLVSFEIMPMETAQACKVGTGRGEPNVDPFLPEPTGRFQ